jgi:predicted metal-binding protein
MDMTTMGGYLNGVIAQGVKDALVVEPSKVITAPWVRMKCGFGCPMHGKSLCCPPYTPTWEETRAILDSYECAILLHRQDAEGIDGNFNEILVDLEKTLFLDGYYKAFTMGSGPCRICKECDPSASCRNPMKARPSMESCGIDVFRTARENGLPISTVRARGDEKNIYGLVLVE